MRKPNTTLFAGQEKQEDFCGGSCFIVTQGRWDAELWRRLATPPNYRVVYSRTTSRTLSWSGAIRSKPLTSVLRLQGLGCKSYRDPRRCSTRFQSCRGHQTCPRLYEPEFPIADE